MVDRALNPEVHLLYRKILNFYTKNLNPVGSKSDAQTSLRFENPAATLGRKLPDRVF